MKIGYTGAYIVAQPTRVQTGYVMTAAGLQQIATASTPSIASDTVEKPVQLKDIVGALPAGGLATGALHMYQLGNTTSQEELIHFMLTNNVAPSHADTLSQQVLNVVNSSGVKSVFIGFAGGAATFGVLEVIKPHWSWQKKLLWSLVVAGVISATYLLFVNVGVMR
jgi:hypothetical protein